MATETTMEIVMRVLAAELAEQLDELKAQAAEREAAHE